MSRKKKYQLTRNSCIEIEVDSQYDEQVVDDLNREFERFEKSEQRYQKRIVLKDENELANNEISILEKLIIEEEKLEFNKKLYAAINSLTDKQKDVIYLYFFEKKTLREIAKIRNVNYSVIQKQYANAIIKIQIKLNIYKK